MDENGAGPSTVQRTGEAVLNEVLVNASALREVVTTGQPAEDQDLALAKLLQEQERAFLALSGIQGPAENVPPPAPEGAAPDAADGDPDCPLTDEELAWRLMQEEEAAFQQRMLALAGVPVPGADDGAVSDADTDAGPDPDAMSYEELTALGEVVGTVAAGLTQAQINELPVKTYADVMSSGNSGDKAGAAEEEEEQCAVCRLEFEADDEVTVLRCGHYFHPPCVGQWLQAKKVCVVCKAEVLDDGENGGK